MKNILQFPIPNFLNKYRLFLTTEGQSEPFLRSDFLGILLRISHSFMPKRINMKKTLIHAVAFTLASAVLMAPGYASSKTDEGRLTDVDGNVQFSPTRWRFVRHTVVLHLPQESKPVTQIIIATPPTVAVSNDIDVLEYNGRKFSFYILVLDIIELS